MSPDLRLRSGPGADTDLIALALALGLGSGLVEGVGHMVLQKLNVLENVWYQIIWIAALFNGVLVAALGLALSLGLWLLPGRPRLRTAAVFTLVLAACLPCFALMLKEWIKTYSILILLFGTTVIVTRMIAAHEPTVIRRARKSLPWLAGIVLFAVIGIQGGFWLGERKGTAALPPADPSAPNIVLIVVDTLRSDHLSSYGYGRASSPAIDLIAKGGVLFEQAFSTSSYTLPSHESILTGLYPHEHGIEWDTSHRPRSSSHPTLPETLQGRGYRTGAFSGNTNYFTREHGFGRGFLHFEDFFHSVTDMAARTAYGRIVTITLWWRMGFIDNPGRKHADDTNRAVLRWIGSEDTGPYFVFINYMDVHDPYVPPPPYQNKFSKSSPPRGLINQTAHVPTQLTPEQLQDEIDAYDGAIAYVDDQIGRLITTLEQRQSDRQLLVVITSDHGEEFYEHGGFVHGTHLYREATQVPLIFSLPGRIPPGVRVAQPVSNTAIPATIMELLDDREALYPGPPLQRLWNAHETPAVWPFPLAELKQRPWATLNEPVRHGTLRSMVSATWHYIEQDGAAARLFDLASDPREGTDIGRDPEVRSIVSELQRQLRLEIERKPRQRQ